MIVCDSLVALRWALLRPIIIATIHTVWDSALRICFHSFLQLIRPQSWVPIYTFLQNIPTCKTNIFIADSYKSKFTSKVIIGWVAVSAVVAAIDFAGTVTFGVDYNTVQVTQPENYIDWATSCKKPKNRVRLLKRKFFYSPLCWERLWEQGSF